MKRNNATQSIIGGVTTPFGISVVTILEIFEKNQGFLEENQNDQASMMTIKLQPT